MSDRPTLTRRSFLLAPALLPLAGMRREADLHHFTFDHVVGTSLDLDLWASSPAAAEQAAEASLDEIARLTAVLDTRDPDSEINRIAEGSTPSRDLGAVLAAYDSWTSRTNGVLSITPQGKGSARNVDALGKAYILDRVADLASRSNGITAAVVNIGGDIVVRGATREIAIAHPASPQDNAAPLTIVRLTNQAIATSGSYARGSHLIDARTGDAVAHAAASVIAPTALDANALATMLCVTTAAEGVPMVERVAGAEAIRIDRDGGITRTSGFAAFETPRIVRAQTPARWPAGYELNIALTLTAGAAGGGREGGYGGGFGGGRRGGRGGAKRPYVAVWIEDPSGRLVRVLAFWADKERYYSELSSFYSIEGRDERRLSTIARATRSAGSYQLVWDGLNERQQPVPPGTYRVIVETNQEHGSYGKQGGAIECKDKPAHLTLSATANFAAITVDFGPRQARA